MLLFQAFQTFSFITFRCGKFISETESKQSMDQIGPGNSHGHYLRRFRPANRHKLGLPLQWKEHTFAVAMCDIAREAEINLSRST